MLLNYSLESIYQQNYWIHASSYAFNGGKTVVRDLIISFTFVFFFIYFVFLPIWKRNFWRGNIFDKEMFIYFVCYLTDCILSQKLPLKSKSTCSSVLKVNLKRRLSREICLLKITWSKQNKMLKHKGKRDMLPHVTVHVTTHVTIPLQGFNSYFHMLLHVTA